MPGKLRLALICKILQLQDLLKVVKFSILNIHIRILLINGDLIEITLYVISVLDRREIKNDLAL